MAAFKNGPKTSAPTTTAPARPASAKKSAFANQFATTKSTAQRMPLQNPEATGTYTLRVDKVGVKVSQNPARMNEEMMFVKFTVLDYTPDREGLATIASGEERNWARSKVGSSAQFALSEFRSILASMAGISVNSSIPPESFGEGQPMEFIATVADTLTAGDEYPHDAVDENGNEQVAQFIADWNAQTIWPLEQEITCKVYMKAGGKKYPDKSFCELAFGPANRRAYTELVAAFHQNDGSIFMADEQGA